MKINSYITIIFVVSYILTGHSKLAAQLSGNNMMEYQLGNIPDIEPEDLSTLYDQLNLQYRYKGLKASLRLEQFFSTDSLDRDYLQLSQFLVQYRYKKIELKVGNFYETLGRGLVYRSFEIPGSIKEERIYRVRHGFYRDLLGVSFKYTGDVFKIKAIRGKPLNNTLYPGHDDQRTELIEAVQPEISLWNQSLGLIGMRHSMNGDNTYYASMFLQGTLPLNFTYYGEYARNMTQNANILEFNTDDEYGAYLSITHSYGRYGSSLEFKKYQNFVIGTGISDPPTLVKEHYYRLLNRTTHITELTNEGGFQFEVYYTFDDGKMITLNTALAKNKLYEEFTFNEYFAEFYWPFENGSILKSFFDFSIEELRFQDQRYAGGIYYTQMLKNNWSVSLESETQFINGEFYISNPVNNTYLGLIVSKSTKLSGSIYYEFTSDETIADRPGTEEIETKRHYYGVGFTYRPNFKNTIALFVGERRGGPACNSGVCYEVLDFRGIEIRWTIRF